MITYSKKILDFGLHLVKIKKKQNLYSNYYLNRWNGHFKPLFKLSFAGYLDLLCLKTCLRLRLNLGWIVISWTVYFKLGP